MIQNNTVHIKAIARKARSFWFKTGASIVVLLLGICYIFGIFETERPPIKADLTRRKCAKTQANFYINNFNEFKGEDASSVLKEKINILLQEKFSKINVVDVSANIGQLFEFLTHKDSTVHLFEPNPINFEILEEKFSEWKSVTLHQNAVSDVSGNAAFYFNHGKKENKAGNEHGALGATMSGGNTENNKKTTVEVVTLDETVEPLFDRLHLLKTDTEGFDVIALRGAKKLLMKTDMIIFECHFIQQKKAGGPGTTDYEVAQDLSDLGFEVYHLHPEAILRFDGEFYDPIYDIKKGWQNCFAVKSNYAHKRNIIDQYTKIC